MVGGTVIKVEPASLHIPVEDMAPVERTAMACWVEDNDGDVEKIFVEPDCPVGPGDNLWRRGDFAYWTPKVPEGELPVCVDRKYIRADYGWQPGGGPSVSRIRWGFVKMQEMLSRRKK